MLCIQDLIAVNRNCNAFGSCFQVAFVYAFQKSISLFDSTEGGVVLQIVDMAAIPLIQLFDQIADSASFITADAVDGWNIYKAI